MLSPMDGSVLAMLAMLVLVPAGWAALLRWARCPGWAVVGGLIGGLMLGPTIFGRVMPHQYEAMVPGGVRERLALQHLTGRHGADLIAAEIANLDDQQTAQLKQQQARELKEAQGIWQNATWAHQRPLRLLTSAIVLLTLLGAGVIALQDRPSRPGIVGPLSVGAWSAAVSGGLAFFAMRWLWDEGVAESAVIASAVAMGPWVLTAMDHDAANQAELGGAAMVQRAGRFATLLAVVTASWALWAMRGWGGLAIAAPLLAAPASWSIAPVMKKVPVTSLLAAFVRSIIVPALAASVAIKVDLYQDFAVWPIVIFMVLSGDGRWLGAFTGAMVLGQRRALRTMRLVLGSMAAGPTQLAVTAIAVHSAAISSKFTMALLLSAVLIEVTAPARRSMARRLIQTEQEIEAMSDEG